MLFVWRVRLLQRATIAIMEVNAYEMGILCGTNVNSGSVAGY